jgi:hypothetical protein
MFWQGCGGKGTLIHCWWECKLVQPLWKRIWRLLKNVNIDLPYDPAIPLLGINPKKYNTDYSRGTCTPIFIAALFRITKLWKQPRCPTTDEWIKKMWYLYTMEFYSAMNKNEILSFAGKWMELENSIYLYFEVFLLHFLLVISKFQVLDSFSVITQDKRWRSCFTLWYIYV